MPGLGRAQGQRAARAGCEAGIDPVCHTLVGAGLARAGLARRTSLGTATLLIGANLPDVDVLSYFGGPAADLGFRRGWTHGVLALVVLPFVLTGLVLVFDRVRRRLGRSALPIGVEPRQVLLLSTISIFTHPCLDSLNTYGVRWLMPFSGRWSYGDALFIVDPWMWLALGAGLVLSGKARWGSDAKRERPARAALAIALGYSCVMVLSGMAARRIARNELKARTAEPVEEIMAGPLPLTPFARAVVAVQGDRYRTASFRWLRSPHLDPASIRDYPRARQLSPSVKAAIGTPVGRRFMSWTRFPVFQVEPGEGGREVVHIIDLRYATSPGSGFGAITITVCPR